MKAKVKHQADHKRQELYEIIPLRTPLVIYIEPSGFCNLRCNFCPQTTKKMKKDTMSLELFKHCISEISKFCKPVKMLRICGNGEPLLNPDIIDMARAAHNSGIFEKIELVTNGTLINENHIKSLSQYCTRIIISVEGLSGSDYEAMCGKLISFDDFVRNIQRLYLHKDRKCTLMIKIVNESVKTLERQKSFYNNFSNICDEIYIENLVPMWPGLESNYKIKSRWEEEDVPPRQVCVQIFKGVQIQANGDVVACCVDWERLNLLGNIQNESLVNIWKKSEILHKLQIAHLRGNKNNINPCKHCVMNDTCDPDNIDNYRVDLLRRLL